MANALIAYQNQTDKASLSGGSWTSTLPLANLQNRLLSKVARSADLNFTSTKFDITLDRARPLNILALCRHNFGPSAKWRLTAYSDPARTAVVYDSTLLDIWPGVISTLTLEWRDQNFWSGRQTSEDLEGYYWNAIHILPQTVYEWYWRIEIQDSANASGYVEFGRLFMSEAWTPTLNMSYGAGLGYTARTEIEEAWDGTEYFDVRPPYRTAQFQLENMKLDEAMNRAFDMQRIAGVDKEVLFVYDPSDTAHLIRRSFLGRMRELSPIEQPYFEAHRASYTVKELL